MSIVRTDFGDTKENARRLRFEHTASIASTNVQKAIEEVSAASSGLIITPTLVSVSPYAVLPSDTYLFVDSTGGPIIINMPLAADRAGVPLVVKDVGGAASTNNITINRSGGETLDSLTSLTINTDFGGYQLLPRSGIGYTVGP